MKAVDTLLHLNQIDPQVLLVGVVTVVLIVVLDRVPYVNKLSLLIALAVASALVPLLDLTTVPLVSSLGALPDKLPRPVLPDLTFIPGLIGPAFALTIIALAQSAGISQAYVNPDGKYPDTSRDFLGQGAANLAGALFQGLPAGGSLGGTATAGQRRCKLALGQHLHRCDGRDHDPVVCAILSARSRCRPWLGC